jgi:hypothetical protein
VVGQHEAHVEHRHQRLAAGQELGVVQRAQQAHGLGKRFRIVVLKGWRLHRGPGAKAAASIGTRRDLEQPLMRRSIIVGLFSLLFVGLLALPKPARAQGSPSPTSIAAAT